MTTSFPSTSSPNSTVKRKTIFEIGTDEIDGAESEHLMYNAISSLSSINATSTSQRQTANSDDGDIIETLIVSNKAVLQSWTLLNKTSLHKRGQRVLLPISVDGFYLVLLGVSTAICSLAMEFAIEVLQQWHLSTYRWVDAIETNHNHLVYTYIVWCGYAVILITSSAIFAHYFSPQTIGSGIPEMKTILRGFILKEYLSFRTLVSKMIGLTLSLGSGLPLGKEGPFVHVASALASQLSRFMTGVQEAYQNESRSQELLAAGCAVGVACTFSTPIGGVLFSIEVTSAYFAVRNYWRGFFASICAATTFRIVRLIIKTSELTVGAYYQTRFPEDAFLPEELPVFGMIGLICGMTGALFIKCHRMLVIWLHNSSIGKKFFHENWLLYPLFISLLVSSITYPKGAGQFLCGQHKFSHVLRMFLSNCTWSLSVDRENGCTSDFINEWSRASAHGVFFSLSLFTVIFFILSLLSSTLPIPAGIFMPVFVIGASFGRLMGECVATLFPAGIRSNHTIGVNPGVYAIVGAASFCGSVTHTISVAVIVFELTGQLMHILPVMIAVLVGNIVCSYFQPSIYDSIIMTKALPYIPEVSHCSQDFHTVLAEHIMVSDVKFIWKDITYYDLKTIIEENRCIRSFPVVLDRDSRILLGSVGRKTLTFLLESKVGDRARQLEAARRVREALSQDSRHESNSSIEFHSEKELRKLLLSRRCSSSNISFDKLQGTGSQKRWNSDSLRLWPKVTGCGLRSERREHHLQHSKKVKITSPSSQYNIISPRRESLTGVLRRSVTRLAFSKNKKEVIDLSGDERARWEAEQLANSLDLHAIHIDAAPYQLVENTSVFKIHSVFSLLGLRRAYVTKLGRLVGVVSLRELRSAIEDINHAYTHASSKSCDGYVGVVKHVDTFDSCINNA